VWRERAKSRMAARCCLQRAWVMGVEWEYFRFSFLSCFCFCAVPFPLVLMAGSLHGWGWVGWEALYCAVICIHTSLFPLNNLLSCTSSPLSFSFSFLPSVDITPLFACSLESWGWQDYNS
jgi:hypothetical protein